jgi:hypothetical protein
VSSLGLPLSLLSPLSLGLTPSLGLAGAIERFFLPRPAHVKSDAGLNGRRSEFVHTMQKVHQAYMLDTLACTFCNAVRGLFGTLVGVS